MGICNAWKKEDYFVHSALYIIGIILITLFSIAVSDHEVSKDTKRLPLSKMLLTISILGTIFTSLLLKVKMSLKLGIIIFNLLLIVSVLVTLIHYLVQGFVFHAFIFEIGFVGCIIWVFSLRVVSRLESDLLKNYLPVILCLIVPLFWLGIPLYIILINQDYSYSVFMLITKTECFTVIFLVTITFAYLYNWYLKVDDNELDELEEDSWFRKYKKLKYLPAAFIYAIMVGVCIYCLVNVVSYIEDQDYSAGFYLNMIYLIASPSIIFVGTLISRLNQNFAYRLNLLTFTFGFISTIIFLVLYLKYPDLKSAFRYPLVLSPLSTVFWAYLSTITKKFEFVRAFGFLCIFLVLPLGFLLPFGHFGMFSLIAAYTVLSLLLLVLLAYMVKHAIKYFQGFKAMTKIDRLEYIKKMTCFNSGLLLITLIFIVSEGTLFYMYFTAPYSSPATGAIISMNIVIVIVYIMSSFTIQVDLRNYNLSTLLVILTIILLFFTVIAGILSGTLTEFGPEITAGSISSCISCIIILIISVSLLLLKNKNQQYGTLYMVICNLFLWVFIIVPLGVVLPSTLSRATSSKSRNKLIGLITVILGIIIMVAVTIISILYNIYLNKLEKERQVIEYCENVCKDLKSNRIKCTYSNVRQFYERFQYFNFNQDELQEFLIKEEIFALNELRNKEVYSKIFTIKNKEDVKKDEKRKLNIWELMNCFNKKDYEVINEQNQHGEDLVENIEDDISKPHDSIQEVDLDELDIMEDEDVIKIRPSGRFLDIKYDYKNNSEFQVVNQEKNFSSLIVKSEELRIDRSKRTEWLGIVFDILSNPPDSYIAINWLSELALFGILRHGGITESMLSNKKIKIIYSSTVMQNHFKILSKSLFIGEIIRDVAQALFPSEDFIKREIKLIVDCLHQNLLINFNKLYNEIFHIEKSQNDPFRLNFIKRFSNDVRCSDRDNMDVYKVYPTTKRSEELNEDVELTGKSPELNEKSKKANKIQQWLYQGCYQWFLKTGEKILNYFQTISEKFNEKLKKFASVKAENNNKEETVNEFSQEKQALETCPEVCSHIMKQIDDARKKKIEELENKKTKKINLRLVPNIITILTKFLEFVQLSAIGLKKEVSWKYFQSPLAQASDGLLIENNPYFLPFFWIFFTVAIFYCFVAFKSWNKIEKSNLGKDDKGSNYKLCSFEGLVKIFVTIVGSSLYITVIKSQLSVFACDIDSDPPVLWHTDIVCYESLHIGHFLVAILCLLFYYPLATFIYPMLQFNDARLEIKFDPSFMIILSQCKLIIAGIAVFLPYQLYLVYQLIATSLILLFLFIYFLVKKPCLAEKMNIWMSAGYFICFITNFLALINYLIGTTIVINIIWLSFIPIAIILAIIFHCKSKTSNKIAHCESLKYEEGNFTVLKQNSIPK